MLESKQRGAGKWGQQLKQQTPDNSESREKRKLGEFDQLSASTSIFYTLAMTANLKTEQEREPNLKWSVNYWEPEGY
jgi:hypothetical protein